MKTDQEKWIDETLDSLDDAGRAPMPASLREKLMQMPHFQKTVVAFLLPKPKVWAIAAGIALLAGLNIYAVLRRQTSPRAAAASASVNPLAREYFTAVPSI